MLQDCISFLAPLRAGEQWALLRADRRPFFLATSERGRVRKCTPKFLIKVHPFDIERSAILETLSRVVCCESLFVVFFGYSHIVGPGLDGD